MGFSEAIEQSGWDDPRKEAARRLCESLRGALRCESFAADPDRIYNNLNSDPRIPDKEPPDKPASRLKLLGDLLVGGSPSGGSPGQAISEFCHCHKQEGPPDDDARNSVLGRVCPLRELAQLFRDTEGDELTIEQAEVRVADIIQSGPEEQKESLARVPLALRLMWSFYDEDNATNPFAGFRGRRAEMVDRLGMGEQDRTGCVLLRWSHELPDGVVPHSPTAWDGGVRRPFWFPCGRTRPLSMDRHPPGPFSDEKHGVPEVVHDPVTGSHLKGKVDFVRD